MKTFLAATAAGTSPILLAMDASTDRLPHAGTLAYLPVSLFGAVMGLAGLALGWRLAAAHWGAPAWAGDTLGVVAGIAFVALAIAYAVKCVRSLPSVQAEFADPVAVNFFGTPIISLLLLAAVALPHVEALARALWAVGTIGMLAFAWLVVTRWMNVRQHVAHATPAWMIPIVGTLNIAVAGASVDLPGAIAASTFGLAIGLFFAVPLFTLILSRLLFAEPLPTRLQPALMILMAPFAVGFSSYVSLTREVDLFATGLFCMATFMFAVLVPKLLRVRSTTPFHVTWWAVSFPLAAMANAALRFAALHPSAASRWFAWGMLAFVTAAILSLTVRTVSGVLRGELRALSE